MYIFFFNLPKPPILHLTGTLSKALTHLFPHDYLNAIASLNVFTPYLINKSSPASTISTLLLPYHSMLMATIQKKAQLLLSTAALQRRTLIFFVLNTVLRTPDSFLSLNFRAVIGIQKVSQHLTFSPHFSFTSASIFRVFTSDTSLSMIATTGIIPDPCWEADPLPLASGHIIGSPQDCPMSQDAAHTDLPSQPTTWWNSTFDF